MSAPKPNFDKFEVSSIARRKAISNAFLGLCLSTSVLSIVILAILILTIIFSALPVFGPHADTLVSESRVLFAQGDGDPEQLDSGDWMQGMFRATSFVRGGLDKNNDELYVDGDAINKTAIGFYSFQVGENLKDNVLALDAAVGDRSLEQLVKKLGVQSNVDLQDAAIVVLTTANKELDFANLEVDGSLDSEKLLNGLTHIDDWSLEFAAGLTSKSDYAELWISDSHEGEMRRLTRLLRNKKAGRLNILASSIFNRNNPTNERVDVKLRSEATNQIAAGHVKVDGNELVGVSRRKRKGFNLEGAFELKSCDLPEADAGAAKHVSHFLKGKPKRSDAAEAGIGPALWGSVWVVAICALFAIPLGIGTAIFLEEFSPSSRWLRTLQAIVQLNITNLAGVPSIVYGLLGLAVFATMFDQFGTGKEPRFQYGAKYYFQYVVSESYNVVLVPVAGMNDVPELETGMTAFDGDYKPVTLTVVGPDEDLPEEETVRAWTLRSDAQGGIISEKPWYYFQLPFGRSVLAASLTLMLVILPVIIIASQEAIRAVPNSLREGAMGLGSTRWQVVRNVTLPAAIPGIMTGAILSISRAIGEAAPIVVLCGTVFLASSPQHLMDFYSVLPIQIFYLTQQPPDETALISLQNVAAAASLILLIVLLSFNTLAIILRQITSKPLS